MARNFGQLICTKNTGCVPSVPEVSLRERETSGNQLAGTVVLQTSVFRPGSSGVWQIDVWCRLWQKSTGHLALARISSLLPCSAVERHFRMPQDLLAFNFWPGDRHCHNKHNNIPGSTSCDWKARDCGRAVQERSFLSYPRVCFVSTGVAFPSTARCSILPSWDLYGWGFLELRVVFRATAPPNWRSAYWAFGVLERYVSTSHGTRESSLDSLLECMKAQIFSQTSSRFRSPSHTGPEEWIWPDYTPLKWMARFRLLFSPCPTISSGIWIKWLTPRWSIVSENWPKTWASLNKFHWTYGYFHFW